MDRWNFTATKLGLLAWMLSSLALAQGPAIPCDGRFFITASTSPGGPSIVLFSYPNNIGSTLQWDTLLQTSRPLGPIGFSVLDNYLYALDTATFEILKIDADGGITVAGNISQDIDTSLEFRAGCVTPPGIKFTLVGRNKTTLDDATMYNVRLDQPGTPVGVSSLVTQDKLQIEDLAYDPIFGVLMGFDAYKRRLVTIGGGLATGYNFLSAPEGTRMSGLFFDREGNLFGYGQTAFSQGRDNTLFAIDKRNGALTNLRSVVRSTRSDACSCPYSVELIRRFEPAEALPCDTVRLVYTTRNRSGFIYRDIQLQDALPEGVRLLGVVRKPLSATILPAGSDSLLVAFSDLVLGRDSIVFEVVIDSAAQLPASFPPARLGRLPKGLGEIVFSVNDSTSSLTITSLSLDLGPDRFACAGNVVLLEPEVKGGVGPLTYFWSDGSTLPNLAVTQAGQVALTVSNGCLAASDTLVVDIPEEALWVELEEEIVVEEGSGLLLNALTNGNSPLRYRWEAPEAARLSCPDCASPVVNPLTDVTILLILTDAQGCEARDSIRLVVRKIRDVQFPNVFTPNGDGLHDTFFGVGEANAQVVSLEIVDRWGRMMFRGGEGPLNQESSGWNGVFNGRPALEGVYYWVAWVTYGDETRERFQGNVTLLR